MKIGALTSKPYAFAARPWELKSVQVLDFSQLTLDPMLAEVRENRVFRLVSLISGSGTLEWITDRARFFSERNEPVSVIGNLQKSADETAWPSIFSRLKSLLISPSYHCGPVKTLTKLQFLMFYELSLSAAAIFRNLIVQGAADVFVVGGTSSLNLTNDFRSDFATGALTAYLKQSDNVIICDLDIRLQLPAINLLIRRKFLSSKFFCVVYMGFYRNLLYPFTYVGSTLNLYKFLNGAGVTGSLLRANSLCLASFSLASMTRILNTVTGAKFSLLFQQVVSDVSILALQEIGVNLQRTFSYNSRLSLVKVD